MRFINQDDFCPIDTRIKILYLLFILSITSFASNSIVIGIYVIMFGKFYLYRKLKLLIFISFVNIIFWYLFTLFLIDPKSPGFDETDFFISMVVKATILGSVSLWFALTTTVYNLVAAIRKLNISQSLVLPFIIAVRFVPTLINEHKQIKESLIVRKLIKPNHFLNLLSFNTFSLLFFPMIIRSIKLSEELAAAGEARGIGRPGKQTFITPPAIKKHDLLFILLITLHIIEFYYLEIYA
ncbi:MAG: energy-coupling factor transporter transmembrane protein EcfT [Candidatus Delongbacteria bacterium]|nr:energy-coupling factor transporter transmembrane protein EcfT [Candidatus Delongbacteria bacterium]MBN2833474.1 energy-coupling factor transporter transmembrane protein EcfT [Candidatus Delongbacteria bacterium]